MNTSSTSGQIIVQKLSDLSKPFVSKNDFYKMTAKYRGYCLIFNNYEFEDSRLNNLALDIDSKALYQVFDQLGFNCKTYDNLTGEGIESTLLKTSRETMALKQHDAFFTFFLSHGNEKGILGCDSKVVFIDEVIKYFSNENCEGLRKKPKVIFDCACLGSKLAKINHCIF
jgi:hypothetical protein